MTRIIVKNRPFSTAYRCSEERSRLHDGQVGCHRGRATRLLPRDGGVEELHGNPTVRPRSKVRTRGQVHQCPAASTWWSARPSIREVSRNGVTTTPRGPTIRSPQIFWNVLRLDLHEEASFSGLNKGDLIGFARSPAFPGNKWSVVLVSFTIDG